MHIYTLPERVIWLVRVVIRDGLGGQKRRRRERSHERPERVHKVDAVNVGTAVGAAGPQVQAQDVAAWKEGNDCVWPPSRNRNG